jgi:hypothetical protein
MTSWLQRLTEPSPTNEAPTRGELRRNDLLVAALVIFALLLAFGIRNQVLNASKTVRLGENLPRIAYPEAWRVQSSEGTLLHVFDPGSPSTFDTQMTVTGRSLRVDESLEDARADRGIKLATSLPSFRELEAERVIVLNDQPALVSTYAYIADPTLDAGAAGLPVVVQAQDIMFLGGGQFLMVTLEADANHWEDEERAFAIITNSLRLQPLPEGEADIIAPEPDPELVPDTEAAPLPAGATEPSGAEDGSFGSGAQNEGGVMPGESEVQPATIEPGAEATSLPATTPGPAAGENSSETDAQSEGGSE